jgi:hypothetical protein
MTEREEPDEDLQPSPGWTEPFGRATVADGRGRQIPKTAGTGEEATSRIKIGHWWGTMLG